MGAVVGVDPQDAGGGWTLLVGDGIAEYLTTLTLLGEDLDGEELGEVVRAAGFAASEVGDVVLPQVGLAVDGDQWLDCELTEVGVAGELACAPGLVVALGVVVTIIVDFQGVFLLVLNCCYYWCEPKARNTVT